MQTTARARRRATLLPLLAAFATAAQAQASYDPATRILTVPTIAVDGQTYTDLRARLDADGRLTIVALTPPAASIPLADRTAAATATATSSSNGCAAVRPFYWEVGDAGARRAGGAVAQAGRAAPYDANTPMNIASASKWLYGAYVAERRGGVLGADDIAFLSFRSGYTNFPFSGCEPADTVASCVARGSNGVQAPEHVGRFYYGGGHMQKHASLATPGMDLGPLGDLALAAEMRRVLGMTIELAYTQPQLAGGVRTTPAAYAEFLRRILRRELAMASLLGAHAVCTNPATCATADYAPMPAEVQEMYSIGHWVETDPFEGDGAFSSPGAFGFYPWIDAGRTTYGLVARVDPSGRGTGYESQVCGAAIRRAWLTGQAR